MMNVIKIFLVFLIGCSMNAQEEDFFTHVPNSGHSLAIPFTTYPSSFTRLHFSLLF